MPPRPSRQLLRWMKATGRSSAGRVRTGRCGPAPCHSPAPACLCLPPSLHAVSPCSPLLECPDFAKLFPRCRLVCAGSPWRQSRRGSVTSTAPVKVVTRYPDHFSGDLSSLILVSFEPLCSGLWIWLGPGLIEQREYVTGLWLVQSDHVTSNWAQIGSARPHRESPVSDQRRIRKRVSYFSP